MTSTEILAKIGERSLYGQLIGDHSLVVILDAGLGETSSAWLGIATEVAAIARVFIYDRAGMGKSDPAPTPRTAKDMVADLRHLLAVADLQPPYVLLAHSWTGINARYFANEFPDEISGMIFVDSVHEDKYERFEKVQTDEQNIRMWAAVRDPSRNDERIDRIASIEQVRANQRVHNFPLIVLTRAAENDPWSQIETGLQSEFLKLSTNSKQYISSSPNHFLNETDPALILRAIREIVAELTIR